MAATTLKIAYIGVVAAQRGNPDLAFQAVYEDPTYHPDLVAAWRMFRRMLALSRNFLPGWKFAGRAYQSGPRTRGFPVWRRC